MHVAMKLLDIISSSVEKIFQKYQEKNASVYAVLKSLEPFEMSRFIFFNITSDSFWEPEANKTKCVSDNKVSFMETWTLPPQP